MGLELTAMLYTSRILPLIRVLNFLTPSVRMDDRNDYGSVFCQILQGCPVCTARLSLVDISA